MSPSTAELVEKLLLLIPGLFMALGFGYKLGNKNSNKAHNELMQAKLDLERAQNEKAVKDSYDGKSADAIVDAELSRSSKE